MRVAPWVLLICLSVGGFNGARADDTSCSAEKIAAVIDDATKLDASLRDLAMLLGASGSPSNHSAFVRKAIRRRVIAHARRDDARDLRRHVGTEHGDVARLRLD